MLAMLAMLELAMMLKLATMMLEFATIMTSIWIVSTITTMTTKMAIWIMAPMMRRTMSQVVNSIGGGSSGSTAG